MTDLLESDQKNIWHPFSQPGQQESPIFIESASGVYLHTNDGRRIIDAISSWWVNLHGHSNPQIAKAISDQATKLEHVIFAGFTHEPAITLSKNLMGILPDNQSRIFFSDDGSTAVEVAIKLALQYWRNQGIEKRKLLAIRGAYHGDTFGAMSVGERGIFTDAFVSHLFDVDYVDFPDQVNEAEVLNQFQQIVDTGLVAAFIYEPLLQGAAGMRIYGAPLLDKMIGYAQSNSVICIADEVLTGFGRTGKLFASDHLINKPDLIALSKGLTGGALPLGVTSCSGRVVAAFQSNDIAKTFFHGHSFTANPLACAAANASFELLLQPACQKQIADIGILHERFKTSIVTNPHVMDVRSLGTVLAIELKTAGKTSYVNPARKKIYQYFLERNVLLRPLGNVIYILPPYIITEAQLQTVYDTINEFLNHLE